MLAIVATSLFFFLCQVDQVFPKHPYNCQDDLPYSHNIGQQGNNKPSGYRLFIAQSTMGNMHVMFILVPLVPQVP